MNKKLETRLKYLLEEKFKNQLEYKIIKRQIHRPKICNCECILLEIKYDKKIEKDVNYFTNYHGIEVNWIKTEKGKFESEISLNENSIRTKFHELYTEVLPDPLRLYNVGNNDQNIDLMFYKSSNESEIQVEIVTDRLCDFCKKNKNHIQSAINLRYINYTWFIEGTGCSCTPFPPIRVSEIDENLLENTLINIQTGKIK